MFKKAVCVLFLFNGYVMCASSAASSWINFAETLKNAIKSCPVNLGTFDCLKGSSLKVFDNMITSDVIPLTMDVRLIRQSHKSDNSTENRKSNTTERSYTTLTNEPWSKHILKNIFNLARTHTLKIDFTQSSVSGRARHRHRNQMFPMMIFGVTALGVFTIPMGFQFLSVISGKALLLAKMALMLAMMNGFKRVATSGVHYGLYHTDQNHHGYHYLDRGDMNRPRSVEM